MSAVKNAKRGFVYFNQRAGYTCKAFDEKKAVEVTKGFWKIGKIESQSF